LRSPVLLYGKSGFWCRSTSPLPLDSVWRKPRESTSSKWCRRTGPWPRRKRPPGKLPTKATTTRTPRTGPLPRTPTTFWPWRAKATTTPKKNKSHNQRSVPLDEDSLCHNFAPSKSVFSFIEVMHEYVW